MLRTNVALPVSSNGRVELWKPPRFQAKETQEQLQASADNGSRAMHPGG